MRSIFAFLAEVRRLAAPYFWGEDRWAGRALLAAVIFLELASVFLNVQFNEWNARFYNAVQNKDLATFWHELAYFCGLAALFIIAAVYQLYLRQWLQIRWRTWLTEKYVARWLKDGTHYRMRTVGDPADTSGNTLYCRIYHGGAPAKADPDTHCTHAGPDGTGETRHRPHIDFSLD